ncbi:hypothetical protein RCL1_000436 [Eukaryota sp. TZLM3-RCL]
MLALLLGQFVSILATTTSIISQLLAQHFDTKLPITQATLGYLFLALFSSYSYLKQSHRIIPWRTFFLYSVLDSCANILIVKAFQYTSISSIMLLDCFSLVVCVVLGFIVFKFRLYPIHIFGILLSLTGMVYLVVVDIPHTDAPNPLLGDLLTIVAATLYGICNTLQEFYLETVSPSEFCFSVGISGTFVGIFVGIFFESSLFFTTTFSGVSVSLLVMFALALSATYLIVPYVLTLSTAAFLNLSLLTSDCLAVFADTVFFGKPFRISSVLSLVLIVLGLALYLLKPIKRKMDCETSPLI